MKTIKSLGNLIVWTCVLLVIALVAFQLGVFDGMLEGERTDRASTTGPATVKVVPKDLPCKARIDASVPVKAEAKYVIHTWVGSLTTNTDTVWMRAKGDVDTCFPATGAVVQQSGKHLSVTIDAGKTVFNRPRVKPVATARSVHGEPGAGRQMLKLVPIVDFLVKQDNSRLTMEAQAFAQSIIGGSKCMKAAWPATRRAIVKTYIDEGRRAGIPAKNVDVEFRGSPKFGQNDMKQIPEEFGDTDFTVDSRHTVCRLIR